jgi:hypothetical protein
MKHFSAIAALIVVVTAVPCAAIDIVTKVGTTGTYDYVVDGSSALLYRPLHGDGASAHFDIAIIGDGYQKTDLDQQRLTSAAERFVAGLFAVAPYTEAGACINVYLVSLISTDSGIDDPDQTPALVHDTALDCTFVTGSMEIKGDNDKSEEACSLAGVPFDAIYVIVNDSGNHDGSWAEHATGIAFSSDLFAWGTVMAHELGHLVARLADEYRAPDCDACACPADCASEIHFRTYTDPWVPEEPNVTNASDPAFVPWKDLLDTEALPTTSENVCEGETIGRWEGAAGECYGIYRPREYCLMDGVTGDDPLVDDFCPVCSRAIVDALATYYACAP